jgi:hypothetical protein
MKPQQQVYKDTVLIPGGETLIDKTVRVYLSVTHSFRVRFRFFWIQD